MNEKQPITLKQRRVLDAIRRSPDATDADLMAGLGIKVRSHLNYYVKALIRKGRLRRAESRPRFEVIE